MAQDKSNNALIQQLKKHFNLKVDPFSEASAFFFEGAQRQHNLETIRHLSSFGDMVLLLVGEKGSGKTFLLKRILNSNFEGLNVVYLDCEKLLHERHGLGNVSLQSCLDALGVNKDVNELAEGMDMLLKESHRLVAADGVRTLFMFDNAEKLPKKELQAYYNFCRTLPDESSLVMLFSGQASLIQTTKTGSNLEQDSWFHQIQLKPFSKSDVVSYLEQAMVASGGDNALELSDSQKQQLLELGKGLPGRLNKLFPSVVLEPGLLKLKPKSKKLNAPASVLFALAGLLVLSFLFVSYQHGLFTKLVPVFSLNDQQEMAISPPAEQNSDVAKSIELSEAKHKEQQARLAMLDEALKNKGLSVPSDSNATKLIPENHKGGLDHEPAVLNEGEGKQVSKTIEAEIDTAPAFSQKDTEASGVNGSDESALQVDSPEAANKVEASSLEQKNVAEKQAEASRKQDTKEFEQPRDVFGFRDRNWLQQQAESAYAAQILGSYQEETAQNFIKKIGKQKFDVYYLKTEHRGKAWYVVFYGMFPAKTHAQDAVKNAPKIIRNQSPWIRRVSEILASYPKS